MWNHSLCSVRVRNENLSLNVVLPFYIFVYKFFFYEIYEEFLEHLIDELIWQQ